jgi:branched-chain amino acid transport system ATP-binding protein
MILEVDNISKSFGRLKVADSISFGVTENEALGIVGPNGAGKTTLFSLIAGALRPDRGRVRLLGADVTDAPPQARCAAGIARTHQIPHPFNRLTVFENVLVGACFATPRSEKAATDFCGEILEMTGLLRHANKLAGALRCSTANVWSSPARWRRGRASCSWMRLQAASPKASAASSST